MNQAFEKEHVVGALGALMLAVGCWLALFVVPPMVNFGDLGRPLFIHVPTAWASLLVFTVAFVIAIIALRKRTRGWDAALASSVEVGVVLTALLLFQGMFWARPTQNFWWTWDPRLTLSAVMFVSFAGVLSLRSFAEGLHRRIMWTAVSTIIAYVNVPLVYFIVKITDRGIHQEHSTPQTVSDVYHLALRLNAFAMLFLAYWLIARRSRLILAVQGGADAGPPAPQDGPELVAGVEG
ncbi:MAG TPA: transcriptional regulator [Deltaproteobacteria bacterium]|nr:transcriptional regulator [Deltaproteobacteria bacterium]HCP44759.1 transcriptional regulator [Deltaproteobacteria bacterium]